MSAIWYDFMRPLPPRCKDCGYPFPWMFGETFPMNWTDCPKHRPGWFKFYENQEKEKLNGAR